ncbi:hypothetical protein BaRGS_00030934 [Batillaria attramentaria]|uniref:Uncharacterized protein n=1 Tax=Batillaria attramentaria TaxID=370345 RepID=A0ABD0JSU9_9CAEN
MPENEVPAHSLLTTMTVTTDNKVSQQKRSRIGLFILTWETNRGDKGRVVVASEQRAVTSKGQQQSQYGLGQFDLLTLAEVSRKRAANPSRLCGQGGWKSLEQS